MALARWAATVGGYTMGSRVLGFLRDILIASIARRRARGGRLLRRLQAAELPAAAVRGGRVQCRLRAAVRGHAGARRAGGGQVVRRRRSHRPAVDAAGARDRSPDRDAVADACARARLRRRAGEDGADRAAHAPHLPLHPPDLAGFPPRRGAELALSLRRGRGHADPAQSLPDRRPARARALDRNAGPRARRGRDGGRDRAVRLADRRSVARRHVAPPPLCPGSRRG